MEVLLCDLAGPSYHRQETASDSSPVVSKLSLLINTNNERRLGTSQRQLASTVSS